MKSPSAVILEPPKIKSLTVSIVSPSICRKVMGPDAMILVFWMLGFKPNFSLSSFTFIKRLFSSSLLSAISVFICISEVIDISPIDISPACASSSLAFHMVYSAYKLNKQGDNIQPWCKQSIVPRTSPVLMLLLDLHANLSEGRSGGLVFPYFKEFSTVTCDPHSQRLWQSQ